MQRQIVNRPEQQKKIRWKQRLENLKKSFDVLKRTADIQNLTEAERGGLIQFFETSFELSWKTMKDYLESEGYEIKSPRESIKYAFQAGLFEDGHCWMDALQKRNLTSHLYDEPLINQIERHIKNMYIPMIEQLISVLSSKAGDE